MTAAAETMPAARAASPMRRPEYRRLMVGWFATNLGDSALYLVLAIWMRELTGSDTAAALVFLFLGLPALFAPFAGQLADRMSRRRLLVGTNLGTAAVVLVLLLVDGPERAWLIYAVTFLYGLAAYLTAAAQSGLLRDLVPDEELGSANGIFTSIDSVCRIVSPALGAGLFVLAGPWAVVAVAAAGFLVMGVLLLTLRVEESAPEPRLEGETAWHEITAGFRALLADPVLRLLTIATAVAFGITGLLNATIFPLIEDGLRAGPAALGPAQTIQGVGALVGGLCAAAVLRRIGERRLVFWGLVLLGLGIAASLPLVTLGLPEPWMRWAGIGVVQTLIGFGVPWVIVGVVTLRMRLTPARLQGRTSAALTMAISVPQMLLLALGAALLGAVDYRWLLAVSAVGVLGAAASVAVGLRRAPGASAPAAAIPPAG
ncbi:MFS transporter [Agrococcus sp. SL85]|uniref:MFS transporter n=1 Tax=Agrococcus sp. SL85 TaxID=2995141 RepID=UPI00226D1BF1|nr:MFS transporter [Agrococcus sp. SL85]WAC66821.1 MFS transporter [Agrococcus sp. SL85]